MSKTEHINLRLTVSEKVSIGRMARAVGCESVASYLLAAHRYTLLAAGDTKESQQALARTLREQALPMPDEGGLDSLRSNAQPRRRSKTRQAKRRTA